jgi:hypothetical protein
MKLGWCGLGIALIAGGGVLAAQGPPPQTPQQRPDQQTEAGRAWTGADQPAQPAAPPAPPAQPGQRPPAPANAQAAAPVDFTGHWVSIVTEDWRWRMVTPPKGDVASVPLNAAGRKLAESWDLAKDEAAGLQCKAFGAAGVMRQPLRVHITWANPNTLKIETDAGQQTRLLNFDPMVRANGTRSWQGHSVATWEGIGASGANQPQGGGAGAGRAPRRGSLKVVTTNLRAGYLRKNGVPYSENTRLTEYFDRFTTPTGDQWFVVTTVVEDPTYLNQPFITSSNFKREPDGSKWAPSPCKTDPPRTAASPTSGR